tara:strand:+ start:277 stop:912 length:636 start_codon:yes stop_codon:yes gene_type:complete
MIQRPRLTKDSIKQLKQDIKTVSNEIRHQINSPKPFPVTTTQNAVSKLMGYSSFSELTMYHASLSLGQKPDEMDFIRDVTAAELLSVYDVGYQVQHRLNDVLDALRERKAGAEVQLTEISAITFKNAYDAGEINGGLLNLATGLPTYGSLCAETEMFGSFSEGDVFTVPNDEERVTYTVMSLGEIGLTGMPVLKVNKGVWVEGGNGGICVG